VTCRHCCAPTVTYVVTMCTNNYIGSHFSSNNSLLRVLQQCVRTMTLRHVGYLVPRKTATDRQTWTVPWSVPHSPYSVNTTYNRTRAAQETSSGSMQPAGRRLRNPAIDWQDPGFLQ
jgi:hypothetical protein